MSTRHLTCLAIVLLHLGGFQLATAAAQPAERFVPVAEIFGGVGVSSGLAEQTYTSRYTPPFNPQSDAEGVAGQRLTLNEDQRTGFDFGVNLFPHRFVGIQLLAARTAGGISGTSTPYEFLLRYMARQPPQYERKQYTVESSREWPAPTGTLTRWDVGVNAVGRWAAGRIVGGTVSGGLAYYHVDGSFERLGYTTSRLGGHAVLFPDTYELSVGMGPSDGMGLNGGASLDLILHRNLALTADYRFFRGSEVEAEVHVTGVVNKDQIIQMESVMEIQEKMAPAPIAVPVNHSRLRFGLKLRF
jgi:hypothetical protein